MNRIVLNETSYYGAGCRTAIADEIIKRGFTKALLVTDKPLIQFGVAAAIKAVRDLSLSVNIPQHLHEIGVRKEDLHDLAVAAFNDVCTGGNPRPTSVEDIEKLYNIAF